MTPRLPSPLRPRSHPRPPRPPRPLRARRAAAGRWRLRGVELLSTEGVYSRDMGRGNSREGGGGACPGSPARPPVRHVHAHAAARPCARAQCAMHTLTLPLARPSSPRQRAGGAKASRTRRGASAKRGAGLAEGVYSRDMGSGNSREGRGRTKSPRGAWRRASPPSAPRRCWLRAADPTRCTTLRSTPSRGPGPFLQTRRVQLVRKEGRDVSS